MANAEIRPDESYPSAYLELTEPSLIDSYLLLKSYQGEYSVQFSSKSSRAAENTLIITFIQRHTSDRFVSAMVTTAPTEMPQAH